MKKLYVSGTFLLVALFANNALALTTTIMDTAQGLTQNILGNGVAISNVSYTGATWASGYFSNGNSSGLGIDSGIVLTTGAVSNINGTTNTSSSITANNGLLGNAYLTNLVGTGTNDATVLSFDFVSQTDSVYFNYVFASEEYNEYVGSQFNDVFAFDFEGQNIALLPNSNEFVSINNVNNGSYSQFYNDNAAGGFGLEYDGFTDVFTATQTGLEIGTTYRISLLIADAADSLLDSGVFLEGGSFTSDPPSATPIPGSLLLLGSGLVGIVSARRKKKNYKV